MSESRESVTVILPTVRWGVACNQLAEQLRPGDELLVICDSPTDPVASRMAPAGVEILVAGEPTNCAGKANAVAYAMERATNDRFIWTDDDFRRDADWIDRLVEVGERHGPATVPPRFVGSRWWLVLEPIVALFLTFAMYTGTGVWGNNVWGGGTTFTRTDVDVPTLITDLRRCLSDDGILSAHLETTHVIKSMPADVDTPGDFSSATDRIHRFARIAHVKEGVWVELLASIAVAGVALLFPLPMLVLSTVLTGAVYAVIGLRRWTFLLAYPMLFVIPLCFAAGIFVETFEWGGRRYRFNNELDVDVLE